MKTILPLAAALLTVGVAACENRHDATGQTTTTAAERDLKQAGREVGTVAENAAQVTAEAAKRAAEKLDRVKIGVTVCDGETNEAACDGGAPTRKVPPRAP